MEPVKRHALRAHIPEAVTDWLNLLSLGTMSASTYIGNLAQNPARLINHQRKSLDRLKSFLFEMVQFDKL